jgi:hypothetical protein
VAYKIKGAPEAKKKTEQMYSDACRDQSRPAGLQSLTGVGRRPHGTFLPQSNQTPSWTTATESMCPTAHDGLLGVAGVPCQRQVTPCCYVVADSLVRTTQSKCPRFRQNSISIGEPAQLAGNAGAKCLQHACKTYGTKKF